MSFGCLQEAAIGGGDALLPESDGHRLEGEFPGGQWAIPTGQAGRGSKLGRAVIPRAETPVGLTAPSVGKILSKERRPIALPRFSERFTTQERPHSISRWFRAWSLVSEGPGLKFQFLLLLAASNSK